MAVEQLPDCKTVEETAATMVAQCLGAALEVAPESSTWILFAQPSDNSVSHLIPWDTCLPAKKLERSLLPATDP